MALGGGEVVGGLGVEGVVVAVVCAGNGVFELDCLGVGGCAYRSAALGRGLGRGRGREGWQVLARHV